MDSAAKATIVARLPQRLQGRFAHALVSRFIQLIAERR
jgi:hypothetical protein